MPDLLQSIADEMPGYLAAATGSIAASGGFETHHEGMLDLADARDALRTLLQGYAKTYEALGGPIDLGSNDEVLISSSKAYLLLRVHHDSGRFLAVLLSSNGNIGYLRYKMRGWMRQLAREAR